MSEEKKGGFIKRLFGGKKESCCGVQITEIKEDVSEEKKDMTNQQDAAPATTNKSN